MASRFAFAKPTGAMYTPATAVPMAESLMQQQPPPQYPYQGPPPQPPAHAQAQASSGFSISSVVIPTVLVVIGGIVAYVFYKMLEAQNKIQGLETDIVGLSQRTAKTMQTLPDKILNLVRGEISSFLSNQSHDEQPSSADAEKAEEVPPASSANIGAGISVPLPKSEPQSVSLILAKDEEAGTVVEHVAIPVDDSLPPRRNRSSPPAAPPVVEIFDV
jgi:cell division protein FtsL